MTKTNIIIAAGGSGGHIFPAKALSVELKKERGVDVFFTASKRELDKNILKEKISKCFFLSINPMPRGRNPIKRLVFFAKLVGDMFASVYILLKVRPKVVVGFGGYSSGAMLLCAKMLRIPILIHEQNVSPGRANILLGKLAEKIAVSFEGTREYFKELQNKVVFTGNPLRIENLVTDRASSCDKLSLSKEKKTVLIMGGSQGSTFLNETASKAAKLLHEANSGAMQFVHLTGVNDYHKVKNFYRENNIDAQVFSFLTNIGDAYAASDFAISRSGAAAVFELAYYGKPMILVPYPNPKNNQRTNAVYFSEKGAAIYKEEKELTPEELAKETKDILWDEEKYDKVRASALSLSVPDAASRLAQEVLHLVK